MVFFVIDEYKSSAFQPLDVEARAGIFNSAEPDIPPCISAIIRESLTNAMLAADEHPQRFVPHYAVGDPSWRGKYRFFRIRVITDRRPYTEPSVNICVALRVEKPQLTGRSEPQTWVKCPAFRRRGFYDQLRFAESRPRIISREQSDGIPAFLVVHPTAKSTKYRPDAVFSTVGMP